MPFFSHIKDKIADKVSGHHHGHPSDQDRPSPASAPPEWSAAPEESHTWGLFAEATTDEYQRAEAYCTAFPLKEPRLLTQDVVEWIGKYGCGAWSLLPPASHRFRGLIYGVDVTNEKHNGTIKVSIERDCQSVCLLSNYPIMGGLYDIQGKSGVYYEVKVERMAKGAVISVGSACQPYPNWRHPGWNRASSALHLDDLRKFYEDPDGGRDYDTKGVLTVGTFQNQLRRGPVVIGFGYEFASGATFYTFNGNPLPEAFRGLYMPRNRYDVYAAIGVEGDCKFEVNFGAGKDGFLWKEGNEWAWRIEGHVGRFSQSNSYSQMPVPGGGSGSRGDDEQLPAYDA